MEKIKDDFNLLYQNQPFHDRPLFVGDKGKMLSKSKREQNQIIEKPRSREH